MSTTCSESSTATAHIRASQTLCLICRYDLKVFTDVLDASGSVLVPGALVYVATSDTTKNVNWGGPRSLPEIAEQIYYAEGPSGPNYEYLFGMAEGLRNIGEHARDDHIFELEELVKQMVADKGDPRKKSQAAAAC